VPGARQGTNGGGGQSKKPLEILGVVGMHLIGERFCAKMLGLLHV
jgi:hypothetical protein